MVPLPVSIVQKHQNLKLDQGSRGKIKYTANKSETYHIPGCLHRAKKSYQDKNGYAVKKHLRFQTIVQNWVNKNGNYFSPFDLFDRFIQHQTRKLPKHCSWGHRQRRHSW